MLRATQRARRYIDELEKAVFDTLKTSREEAQECGACYYSLRMGGRAMTTQPCGLCRKTVLFCSTNTDAICVQCATANNLCKHCGGDVQMQIGRKAGEYPTGYTPTPE